MVTKEQATDINAPDGYELKTNGIFGATDLVFENGNWISGVKFGLETRYAIFGVSIEKFKVPVAGRVMKIMK